MLIFQGVGEGFFAAYSCCCTFVPFFHLLHTSLDFLVVSQEESILIEFQLNMCPTVSDSCRTELSWPKFSCSFTLEPTGVWPMPRPLKEDDLSELTDQQEWFVRLLDRKFQQQERQLREMLMHFGQDGSSFTFNVEAEKAPLVTASMEIVESERPEVDAKKSRSEGKNSDAKDPKEKSSKQRRTLARVMGEDLQDPPFKAWVKTSLDAYMGLIVVVNLSLMMVSAQIAGSRADYSLDLSSQEPPMLVEDVIHVLDFFFFGIYILDVLVRMVVLKKEWLLDPLDGIMYMNIFDAGLVLVHGLELLVLPASSSLVDETPTGYLTSIFFF